MLERKFSFRLLSEMPQLVFSLTSIKLLQPACVLFLTVWFLSSESSSSLEYSMLHRVDESGYSFTLGMQELAYGCLSGL